MPCPGRRPLAADGRPHDQNKTNVNYAAGIQTGDTGLIFLIDAVGVGEHGRALIAYESTQGNAKAFRDFYRQGGGGAHCRNDFRSLPQ